MPQFCVTPGRRVACVFRVHPIAPFRLFWPARSIVGGSHCQRDERAAPVRKRSACPADSYESEEFRERCENSYPAPSRSRLAKTDLSRVMPAPSRARLVTTDLSRVMPAPSRARLVTTDLSRVMPAPSRSRLVKIDLRRREDCRELFTVTLRALCDLSGILLLLLLVLGIRVWFIVICLGFRA